MPTTGKSLRQAGTMKKSFSLSLILVIFCARVFAAIVPVSEAQQVATNFFTHQTGKAVNQVTLAYTVQNSNTQGATGTTAADPLIYVFNFNGNDGFVMVSAEDLVQPILAYDNTHAFEANHLAPVVQKWMENYKVQVLRVRTLAVSTSTEVATQWTEMYHNRFAASQRSVGVAPLVKSKWNQDPYYNDFCPYDNGARTNAVTGCVATCMAQLMRYWNYPPQGTGYHSYYDATYGTQTADFGNTIYDWAHMPLVLTHHDTAIATLMYHCGVSVDMSYGTASAGGSGAYVLADASPDPRACSEYAYVNYFGYDGDYLQGVERYSYSDADWIALLKTELDAGRPFQYVGWGSAGGHTWVCDGYDNNSMFHMNWGWGGTSDGYFTVDALDPPGLGSGGGSGGFNNGQQALIGIEPPINIIQSTLTLSSVVALSSNPYTLGDTLRVTASVTNSSSNDFHGSIAASLFTNNGSFIANIDVANGVTIPAGGSANFAFRVDSLRYGQGQYKIGIYYLPSYLTSYTSVQSATFTNPVNIVVAGNQHNIQLISAISGDTLIRTNQPFSEFVKLVNNGSRGFSGSVRAALFNSNDSLVAVAQEVTNTSISNNGGIRSFNFYNPGFNIAPGDYYLAIQSYDISSGAPYWVTDNNDFYDNPVHVRVVSAPLVADVYEGDDAEQSPYVFTAAFIAGATEVTTTGSNIHVATDEDYYAINLPTGYTYTVDARVNDSQESLDGYTYTNDVAFSYKTDNVWSATFDQALPAPIMVKGGNLMFHVSDYFSGTTGSYVLDVNITQQRDSSTVGIDQPNASALSVFPNPASSQVTITTGNISGPCTLSLLDILGRTVSQQEVNLSPGAVLHQDVTNLDNGLYILRLKSGNQTHEAKVVVNR